MSNFIEIKNLYKIFGNNEVEALTLVKKGMTKDELLEIYSSIGNGSEESHFLIESLDFENDYYWSSSEYSDKYTWYFHFENGYTYFNDKYETFKVRPIRNF